MAKRPNSEGRAYRAAAIGLAFVYAPRIYPCADCGWPVAEGYCCTTCGSTAPKTGMSEQQRQEVQRLRFTGESEKKVQYVRKAKTMG